MFRIFKYVEYNNYGIKCIINEVSYRSCKYLSLFLYQSYMPSKQIFYAFPLVKNEKLRMTFHYVYEYKEKETLSETVENVFFSFAQNMVLTRHIARKMEKQRKVTQIKLKSWKNLFNRNVIVSFIRVCFHLCLRQDFFPFLFDFSAFFIFFFLLFKFSLKIVFFFFFLFPAFSF